MKVLHVCDAIDPSLGGGTAERTFQLALGLHRSGIDCTVLCTNVGLGEKRKADLKGIRLVAVRSLFRRFFVPLVSGSRIRKLVAEADVVHVTGHWSLLGGMVCKAARELGRPYVYCPAGSLRVFGRSARLKLLYNWFVGRRMVQEAGRCLAVTTLEFEQFREYGVPDSRITHIPNGVHPVQFSGAKGSDFRKCYGLEGRSIILFLGRLSPIKGPDILLDAYLQISAQYPNAHLVFAGPDAELGQELRRKVVKSGQADRVHFTGFLSGQEKLDALAAADLLVVPSRQEAMSLVALEAGLSGAPVLLTDQCGFDEVQAAGGGRITSVDAGAIASALREMLEDSGALGAMGEQLRRLVLDHYTWDGLTGRCIGLYEQLILSKEGQ